MSPDLTVLAGAFDAILHAIDHARLRLNGMPNRNSKEVVEYASAVIDEMGKIVDAKKAYDAAFAIARRKALGDEVMDHVWPELSLRNQEPKGNA